MSPRPSVGELNLFFFDCETGGLSPVQADMIEVACLVTDPTGLTVLGEYNAKIRPERAVESGAAAVNGYTQEKWATAEPLNGPMIHLLKLARNTLFTAHNAPFDWGFFEHAMNKLAMRWPSDYHRIDTVALAFPLLRMQKVPNLKLVTLAHYFNIPYENAHTAFADVRACRSVYLKLMEIYAPFFNQQCPQGAEKQS